MHVVRYCYDAAEVFFPQRRLIHAEQPAQRSTRDERTNTVQKFPNHFRPQSIDSTILINCFNDFASLNRRSHDFSMIERAEPRKLGSVLSDLCRFGLALTAHLLRSQLGLASSGDPGAK